MISPVQRLRGVVALIALAALIFGVPWVLILWGGSPLPTSSPSSWFTEPLTTDGVLGVLVVVMWLAWAHFVVSVVREIAAYRRDRGSRQPVAATSHPLARRLVTSVLLLVSAASISTQTAQAAESTQVSSISSVGGTTGVSSIQRVADELENTASTAVGQADAHEAVARSVGTTHGIKHELGLSYRVQPPHGRHHDSLWDIAERHLGDGRRWTELYELNKDRVQDDGSRLHDADLIYPGWHLTMPDDARGPDIRGLAKAPHAQGHPSATDQTTPQRATPESPPAAHAAPDADTASGPSSTALRAGLGSLGGLIVAGLLFGLRRRRGWDGGPPRGRGSAVHDGEELQLAADTASADVADRAFRQLSALFSRPGMAAPVLRTARLDSRRFTVAFEQAPDQEPPEGWRVLGDGRTWAVDASAVRNRSGGVPSSYGHVVAVGQDHGEHILLNPTGSIVRMAGDRQAVVDNLRAAAVGLATHTWADDLTVVVLGFDEDLSPAGLDRVVQVPEIGVLPLDAVLGRSVAVVSAVPLAHEAVSWMREQADELSVLCASDSRDGADVVVEATGRLTSPRFAIFAEAARLDPATARRLLELYAADPDRDTPAPALEGFASRMLDPDAPAAASVTVLGPLVVSGSGVVEPDRADLTREIIVFLALNPEGVHSNVLAGAVWPRGVDDDVFAAAMDRVERFLATDDDSEGVPAIVHHDAGQWRLELGEVRVDWHVFRAHVAKAPQDRDTAGRLMQALRLVSGAPLSDLPPGRFGWLESTPLRRQMNVAIVQVAQAASSAAADAGDVLTATEALRCGLRAVPAAEPLWQSLLRLSARDGAESVRSTADEMYAVLRKHGSPLGAEATTDTLVQELIPSYSVPARGRTLTA